MGRDTETPHPTIDRATAREMAVEILGLNRITKTPGGKQCCSVFGRVITISGCWHGIFRSRSMKPRRCAERAASVQNYCANCHGVVGSDRGVDLGHGTFRQPFSVPNSWKYPNGIPANRCPPLQTDQCEAGRFGLYAQPWHAADAAAGGDASGVATCSRARRMFSASHCRYGSRLGPALDRIGLYEPLLSSPLLFRSWPSGAANQRFIRSYKSGQQVPDACSITMRSA